MTSFAFSFNDITIHTTACHLLPFQFFRVRLDFSRRETSAYFCAIHYTCNSIVYYSLLKINNSPYKLSCNFISSQSHALLLILIKLEKQQLTFVTKFLFIVCNKGIHFYIVIISVISLSKCRFQWNNLCPSAVVFVKGVPAAEPCNHTISLDFVKLRRYTIVL